MFKSCIYIYIHTNNSYITDYIKIKSISNWNGNSYGCNFITLARSHSLSLGSKVMPTIQSCFLISRYIVTEFLFEWYRSFCEERKGFSPWPISFELYFGGISSVCFFFSCWYFLSALAFDGFTFYKTEQLYHRQTLAQYIET